MCVCLSASLSVCLCKVLASLQYIYNKCKLGLGAQLLEDYQEKGQSCVCLSCVSVCPVCLSVLCVCVSVCLSVCLCKVLSSLQYIYNKCKLGLGAQLLEDYQEKGQSCVCLSCVCVSVCLCKVLSSLQYIYNKCKLGLGAQLLEDYQEKGQSCVCLSSVSVRLCASLSVCVKSCPAYSTSSTSVNWDWVHSC